MARKFEYVSYAAHGGDHAIYPDCRPEFVDALNQALKLADWNVVELHRPFINKTKAQIVKLGAELGVDFEETFSCYQGQAVHCGRCGTCVERILAFKEAGVPDPTFYKDKEFWKQYEAGVQH
jgi:7-cyano-7-deazaguanine synthase